MRKVDIDQGDREWHHLRWGLTVTGTEVKSALGSPAVQKTLLFNKVAQRMTEPQITELTSDAVTRGVELEPMARKAVIEATGIAFTETGMLISEDIPLFGMSPDAIYEEDGVVVGGAEFKCPNSKKHVEYLIGGVVPKEYYDQVKSPFLLSDDVQWWYFASYDDRNYEHPLFLLKVTREDFKDIDGDRDKIKSFIKRVDDQHEALTF